VSSASTNGAWNLPFTSLARNGHTWWVGWLSLYSSVPGFGVNVIEDQMGAMVLSSLQLSMGMIFSFCYRLPRKVKFGHLPSFSLTEAYN